MRRPEALLMKRFLLLALLASPLPTLAQDVMFRGNPEHTGVYGAAGVPQFTGVKRQFHTQGQILSSPAIAGDKLYFGSSDHSLYALDLATGALKWKFKSAGRITSSPALSAGVVYFGSFDGNFYALDAATGQLKWKFQTGGERRFAAKHLHGAEPAADTMPDPFDFYLSSPVVWNSGVYFGSGDTNVYALDAASGKERWSFSNKVSWVISSPATVDGRVYFATSDTGLLHAFDAKSGAPLYSVDFKHWPMFSSPAIAGETLYIGSHQGRLNAVDLQRQKVAWTFETEDSKKNGPTYTKPDGTPNYEAAFSDFFYDDMVTGVQKLMSVGAILSSPAVAGNSVYVGSTDGNVYALR